MDDEFDMWNGHKKRIHCTGKYIHFREGDIRWVYFGKNVGTEIMGKGEEFFRPVLVVKKVYRYSAIVVPLSSHKNTGNYYFSFTSTIGVEQCANLAQVKYIDGKRFLKKTGMISQIDFVQLKNRFCKLFA